MMTSSATAEAEATFAAAMAFLTSPEAADRLPEARILLDRAARAGHVDAALYEIAFLANGTGGDADWGRALAALRAAALRDDVARRHLAAIDAMAIDDDGMPVVIPDPESLYAGAGIRLYRHFATAAECQLVAAAVLDLLEPATVVDPSSGRRIRHPIRTSDHAAVSPTREGLPIAALNRRIAAATGTSVEQGEPLTVLRYGPGDQYRPHHDAIVGAANARIRTAILYLNHGYTGGETAFPDAGVRIAGQAGDLLVFDNLDQEGRPHPATRHAGRPVGAGTKWIATRWIRARAVDPWRSKTLE